MKLTFWQFTLIFVLTASFGILIGYSIHFGEMKKHEAKMVERTKECFEKYGKIPQDSLTVFYIDMFKH